MISLLCSGWDFGFRSSSVLFADESAGPSASFSCVLTVFSGGPFENHTRCCWNYVFFTLPTTQLWAEEVAWLLLWNVKHKLRRLGVNTQFWSNCVNKWEMHFVKIVWDSSFWSLPLCVSRCCNHDTLRWLWPTQSVAPQSNFSFRQMTPVADLVHFMLHNAMSTVYGSTWIEQLSCSVQ